jgi:quinol monooxygenase YgiN
MIIVSGRLTTRPGARDRFLAASAQAMAQARSAPGCRDFIVAADPIESNRVNVYEEWESKESLLDFRASGPDEDLTSLIENAVVSEYVVLSSGPA